MTKIARLMTELLIVAAIVFSGSLSVAAAAAHRVYPEAANTPAAEADSGPSVTCTPFGLYGDITTPPLVNKLSDGGDNLTFVGTTNGLYAVAPGGKLEHFLYSPFGIKHIALIDDITGDGIREVVVGLNDTQVPALRCYDGANWEKQWQFAPMTRVWEKQWVDRQMVITDLEVIDDGDSQRIVITSGRCVLSIEAKEGTEQWRFTASATVWRMVTLADLNGDGADEVLVGADDGRLFWLNASTGRVLWQTQVPGHTEASGNNGPLMSDEVQHLVSDIIVVDEGAGKVAVASGYGAVEMYDLREKRREWDTLVFMKEKPDDPVTYSYVCMSLTADITSDDLGEILLSTISYSSQYSGRYSGYMTNGEVALCDSAGNVLWHKGTGTNGATVWPGMAFETSVFEGKPVYLDSKDGIVLVDLRDGESVLHRIPLDALKGWGVIMKQPGEAGYFSFSSSSDLAAISDTGELLWYYPRIGNIKTVKGSFVGDSTEDVLLCGGSGSQEYSALQGAGVRLLRMIDGATKATAWSYNVPYGELKGVQVTADLVGSDNIQDIIGYCGDRILIFSGKDGALSNVAAGQPITSLDVIRNGVPGNAFAVGIANGLLIFDTAGTPLWTTTAADWIGDGSGRFMALDDINSDNVSDLAVFSSGRILVLKSPGQASDYELHLTLPSESGFRIRLPEMVADSDRDGLRELAYLQEGAPERQEGRSQTPPHHLLCTQSLEDGQSLFKVDLQGTVYSYDLACGDFNADGYQDSAMLVLKWADAGNRGDYGLRVLSGKDGNLVWEHVSQVGGYGYSSSNEGIVFGTLPVANVGDMNGDGADELACNVGQDQNASWDSRRQQRLQIFDVAHKTTLKDIAVAPHLHSGSFGDSYDTGTDEAMLLADLDNDGRPEVLMKVAEPSVPSYDQNVFTYHTNSSSPRYLGLVDMDNGLRLTTFKGFETTTMSLLPSNEPGTLVVAACGGVCSLRIGSGLEVTSPEDKARTEPIVGIEWQGSADGSFSQVFVDGVRNDVTSGIRSELFLSRGDHTIVVRSVDDWGRVSYSPSDLDAPLAIKVTASPWKPVWLLVSLLALVVIVLALFHARLQRTWRARKRATK